VLRGNDPQQQKTARREAGTFKELADLYMEKHSTPNKKSWRDDRRMFDNHLFPKLKHMKAADVTQDDCEKLLEDMAEGRPVMANRVRASATHVRLGAAEANMPEGVRSHHESVRIRSAAH
jgi:hypothetical protein